MEIKNVKLRQLFNDYFNKKYVGVFADSEADFYGKPDVEQLGYILEFFESKNLVVMIAINGAMFNKYFAIIHNKATNQTTACAKNCKTSTEAYLNGIEQAEKLLLENGNY